MKWFEFWCGTYRVGTWARSRKDALRHLGGHIIKPWPTKYGQTTATSAIIIIDPSSALPTSR